MTTTIYAYIIPTNTYNSILSLEISSLLGKWRKLGLENFK